MKRINLVKSIILSVGIIAGLFAISMPLPVGAVEVYQDCSGANADTEVCRAQGQDDIAKFLQTIVNTLLFILGAAAVLVIVVSGATFIMSNGDSSLITAAKNRILYAVIGIIVALMAYAIVSFIISQLGKAT